MDTKIFKVAAISSNRNSFGLAGMILIARDGESWEVAANQQNLKVKGDLIRVPISASGERCFASFGFEIPHQLTKAPQRVVGEIWN